MNDINTANTANIDIRRAKEAVGEQLARSDTFGRRSGLRAAGTGPWPAETPPRPDPAHEDRTERKEDPGHGA